MHNTPLCFVLVDECLLTCTRSGNGNVPLWTLCTWTHHCRPKRACIVEVKVQTCEVLGQTFPWWVLVYCCLSFYQTLPQPPLFLTCLAESCSTCSLIATVHLPHDLTLPHLLGHTQKSAGVLSWNNFPVFIFSLFSHILLCPHWLSPLLYFFLLLSLYSKSSSIWTSFFILSCF